MGNSLLRFERQSEKLRCCLSLVNMLGNSRRLTKPVGASIDEVIFSYGHSRSPEVAFGLLKVSASTGKRSQLVICLNKLLNR